MIRKISALILLTFIYISPKAQTLFYPSGIDSPKLEGIYQEAMFSLINSEPKKFYTLMEEVIRQEPNCFKAKAHCAFQTFQVTKGEKPFPDIASLAISTLPQDEIDEVYLEVLKLKLSSPTTDITEILINLSKEEPSVEIYYLLGNIAVAENDLESAHKNFYRAFRIKEDFAPILSLLAQTSEKLGFEFLAKDFLDRYIKRTPENPKSHELMGNYLAGKGEYSQAVEYFKKAYELDASYTEALEKAKRLRGRFSEN